MRGGLHQALVDRRYCLQLNRLLAIQFEIVDDFIDSEFYVFDRYAAWLVYSLLWLALWCAIWRFGENDGAYYFRSERASCYKYRWRLYRLGYAFQLLCLHFRGQYGLCSSMSDSNRVPTFFWLQGELLSRAIFCGHSVILTSHHRRTKT